MSTTNISLSNIGLIFDYTISSWTGNKTDNEVSDEVATKANSSRRECGKYIKKMLGNCPELVSINSLGQSIRAWIKSKTLPYSRGQRIVPNDIFIEFIDEVGQKRDQYANTVEEFLVKYTELVDRARSTQGLLFKESELPTIDEVRSKFKFTFTVLPIPESNQFDGKLGIAEMENQLKQSFQDEQNKTLERCRNVLVERLREPVAEAVQKLDEYYQDMDNKSFYKAWLTKIWKAGQDAANFNVTNSEEITKICDDLSIMSLKYRQSDQIRYNSGNVGSSLLGELKGVLSRLDEILLTSLITYGEIIHDDVNLATV